MSFLDSFGADEEERSSSPVARSGGVQISRGLVRLFWSYVQKGHDCYGWGGYTNEKGYGIVFYKGEVFSAHRLSFMIHTKKEIPPTIRGKRSAVCHSCDNPPCTRFDHLFLGTFKDNMQDMIAKGRGNWKPRPEKLSPEQKEEIRALLKTGVSTRELARNYGVSHTTIQRVGRS